MELWFSEYHLPGLRYSLKVKNFLYTGQSKYQRLDFFETYEFGKVFTLDGIVMLTEKDEFVYHEMMAHLPSLVHPAPKRALVIGGGDGGTIRELLKHESYESLDLCEIDKEVVDKCKIYFPETASKLDDPKVNLYFEDGIKFVQNKKNYYDIICVDSTDPIGPAVGLFKEDFYRMCYDALTDDGILIAQSESIWYHGDIIKEVNKAFKKIFPEVKLAVASLICYQSGFWSFTLGSKKYNLLTDIDENRAKRIEATCKYYNLDIHKSCFYLPNFAKEFVK